MIICLIPRHIRLAALVVAIEFFFFSPSTISAQGPGIMQKTGAAEPTSTTMRNLGLSVNSVCNESKPMISPDGKMLYFARKHSPQNVGGVLDAQDIWTMKLNHAKNCPAINSSRMNTRQADNLCAIINDSTFIFYRMDDRNSGHFEIREFSDNKVHTSLMGPPIENESPYLEACVTANADVIFFTARNKNNLTYRKGTDERDIYISVKTNGRWTMPFNAGVAINSSEDEYSPFLASDGRTLFFASTRPDSYGGVDIYYSKRLGNGWNSWSAPQNAGSAINTTSFDGYFTLHPDRKTGYLISYTQSYGKGDVFRVQLPDGILGDMTLDVLKVDPLLFEKGTAAMISSSYAELDRVAWLMHEYRQIKIEVHGHTDNYGTRESLYKLSQERVSVVIAYLKKKGIDPKRISGIHHGPESPVAKNDSEEGRKLNRRVDVVILGL